jgi:pimeloyl-ACP methyl ester carboxylesterase
MHEALFEEKKLILDKNHTLAYRVCGESPKVQFVFLHGLGGCAGAWEETQAFLYQEHQLSSIAIDLPGHGFSSDPVGKDDPHAQTMAKLIIAGLNQLRFKQKPILVGHCLGGMVATQVISIDEFLFSGLVLMNTIIKTPFYMRLINPFGVLSRFLLLLAASSFGKRPPTRRNYAQFKKTGDFSLIRYAVDIAHTSVRNHLMTFAPVFNYDATTEISQVKIPIQIMAGTRDKLFLPFVAKQMAQALPNAQLTWINKGNHVMVLAKHKEIIAELVQFHKHALDHAITKE